ncbi:hypothetical protein Glove_42g26 [Diversispora epigaea]|uniref:Actin-like ATPase domain-containing protein n=1 Tax=Diversispora epigaea TaxID=1348612 RepID=A0A397JP05_9GLOM|nr:hypothetical protein Glove_42g26 [Diversispora epigaea]
MEFFHIERRVFRFDFVPEVLADIRIAVGIDFGTTFSGFAYAHFHNGKVIINENWPGKRGPKKIPTVLQYDEDLQVLWGFDTLASEPQKKSRRKVSTNSPRPVEPVELFKFYLGNTPDEQKPKLPSNVSPEKAITDYLREMDEIKLHWPDIDFFRMVRLVVTIPAEFTEETKAIMRQCIYNANLINNVGAQNLKFTTEPEAAAIHCMKVIKEHGLKTGASYLVVDCGGGTVDLTVRKLLPNNKLGEDTERSGGYCGGSYVDKEFLKFLEKKVGKYAMKMLRDKHYGQLSYMIQQFCERVKTRFTGVQSEFREYSLDIEKNCPALKQYVNGEARDELSDEEWEIEMDFLTVKSFFDPVVNKILDLIKAQLIKSKNCSVIFLVGGFSESKYLQEKVMKKFENFKIAVPPSPMEAIACGAAEYGLNIDIIKTRKLNHSFGVQSYPKFQLGDPPSRKTRDGRIYKFSLMAKKGVEVEVDQKFSTTMYPVYPNQTTILFELFYTEKFTAQYCDEPGVHKLGEVEVYLPDTHLGLNRSVVIQLSFGAMEIIVTAKNETNGKEYHASFNLVQLFK